MMMLATTPEGDVYTFAEDREDVEGRGFLAGGDGRAVGCQMIVAYR